ILQRAYHCFGRQPVANGIAARSLLSSFRLRTCALERVATVGLELFYGRHWGPTSKIGFVLSFGPRLIRWSGSALLCSSPLAVGSGWLSSHRARAGTIGSTPTFFHHAASLPARWISR